MTFDTNLNEESSCTAEEVPPATTKGSTAIDLTTPSTKKVRIHMNLLIMDELLAFSCVGLAW